MHKLPKKLTPNKLYFLTFLFLFLSFFLGAFTLKVKAQDDEFHSLRPYPADPWDEEVSETALFCGNDLIIVDPITVTKDEATSCETLPNGKEKCSFTVDNEKNIKIDLSSANFPILGNTENVVNVSNDADDSGFDDAGKMNEYVSWYLNGTINRAEYEFLNLNEKEDVNKLIDFSGPLNKLLPWEQQVAYRINTIEQASNTRHNQIVACTVAGAPAPCYQESSSIKRRLSDWEGKITYLPTWPSTWNERIPPQRKNFPNFLDYWEAHKEWRGNSCAQFTIPFFNKRVLLCSPIDNPLRPNYWADLFPYVPFSSTEDRVGLVETQSLTAHSPSEDVVLKEVLFDDQEPAELFFAHTEEVTELASILQKTFAPQGAENNLSTSYVSPTEYCDLVNVRTNEGDSLFAGEIEGVLSYTAEFTCEFEPATNNTCENAGGVCINVLNCHHVGENSVNGGGGCDSANEICCSRDEPSSGQECTKKIYANLSVITKTPKVDEIWARTVAGPSAIFKRIFPKIGEGGAILGLLDIPGATKVTYSDGGLVYAGNPGNKRSGESAELYFPHVGGISEYFLKGIQTILRPKGFGEQIMSGAPGTYPSSGEIDCNQSAPEVSLKGTIDKHETFQLALNWVAGQTGNHVLECYNDTVKRSKEAGVNPALALWVWLHESNGSNYNISDEDFGVHHGKPEGFVNQINGFLSRAKSYTPNHYLCAGKNVTPLEAFAYIYASGTCEPTGKTVGKHTAKDFYDALVSQWSIISPGCPLPSSPTDLGCP